MLLGHRSRQALAFTIAILCVSGLLIVSTGTGASAREVGGTAACVTRAEYRAIAKGMRVSQVRRIVDGSGRQTTRQGKWMTRRHARCGSADVVDVIYRMKRVVRKVIVAGQTPTTPEQGTGNPWIGDVDGNGTIDSVEFLDLDGDGTTDARIDLGRDGRYEVQAADGNGDGIFDFFLLEPGNLRALMSDSNYDGYFEFVFLDLDLNGRYERAAVDRDSDGIFEWQLVDAIGNDGEFDTWQQTGAAQTYNTASSIVTSNVVTLNQLGRLYSSSNPWVGSYYSRPAYWAQPPNRLP